MKELNKDKIAELESLRSELKDLHAWKAELEKQEPVHWRAVLSVSQQHWNLAPNIAGFTTLKAAEQFCAEKKDFGGWDYTLEPLYAAPAVSPDVEKLKAEIRELRMSRSLLQGQHEHEVQSLKVELAKATRELEAALKDAEWISVDDRLPERYTGVMVWPHPSEQVMTAQFGLTHKESAPEWHYSEYISGFGWEEQICNPTHWKPLPAPPAIEQAKSCNELHEKGAV